MKLLSILLLVACVAAGCAFDDDPTSRCRPVRSRSRSRRKPPRSRRRVRRGTNADHHYWDATHRSLSLGGEKALLPAGFTGRMLANGCFEPSAPTGEVVARDGDSLEVSGADYMHICRVQGVNY